MMLRYFDANKKNSIKKLETVLDERKLKQKKQLSTVRNILENVKRSGDYAVIKYEKKFTKVKSKSKNIKFSKNEINSISRKIDKNLKKSIDIAFSRIKKSTSPQYLFCRR